MKEPSAKLAIISLIAAAILFVTFDHYYTSKNCTELIIKNSSRQDSVLVIVTLQSPTSVVGLFGIKHTIGSSSKGYFYAHKGILYKSNYRKALPGFVISFQADNLPCEVAVQQGWPTGINVFEGSVNVPYEVFDISCMDGENCILRSTVSDTVNWATGDGGYFRNFRKAENIWPLINNVDIRGVFPYRCTDCKDRKAPVPENCFGLRDSCSTARTCQVARTKHNGGSILIEYISSTK